MLGVNESDIYTLIRMTTEGVELFDIYDKYTNDDIKVVFLNNENRSKNLDDFRKISPEKILELKVKNNLNEDVYLSEFMTIRLKKYQSKIYHYNEQNSIKIEAENKNNFNLNDIVFEFKEKFAKINNKEEVELIFGGAFSEQQKNFAETGIIFLAGIVIVFAILIFYFNSL
jgi:multidrug efflux pump subunit AcrB